MSNPTVQTIVTSVAQDLLEELGGYDHPALLDYSNRVQLYILKWSRWPFLRSAPQRFITELNQTDYWVGPSGTGPLSVVDTGLNLSDFEFIIPGTISDRSNQKFLGRVDAAPNVGKYEYPDASYRQGRPRNYRYDNNNANIISIYPAPSNQNNFQPFVEAPYCSTSSGGSLPARTYYITISLVDTIGNEGNVSYETTLYIGSGELLVVHPPTPGIITGASGIRYDRYNVYAASSTGQETLQTSSPIGIGGVWTEPTSGLVTNTRGGSTTNQLTPIGGYIIEFRYYSQRQIITSLSDVIQIPIEYSDVITAGINWLGFSYLQHYDRATFWQQIFQDGLRGMIRDKYIFPGGNQFISPDAMAMRFAIPSVETIDQANLTNI